MTWNHLSGKSLELVNAVKAKDVDKAKTLITLSRHINFIFSETVEDGQQMIAVPPNTYFTNNLNPTHFRSVGVTQIPVNKFVTKTYNLLTLAIKEMTSDEIVKAILENPEGKTLVNQSIEGLSPLHLCLELALGAARSGSTEVYKLIFLMFNLLLDKEADPAITNTHLAPFMNVYDTAINHKLTDFVAAIVYNNFAAPAEGKVRKDADESLKAYIYLSDALFSMHKNNKVKTIRSLNLCYKADPKALLSYLEHRSKLDFEHSDNPMGLSELLQLYPVHTVQEASEQNQENRQQDLENCSDTVELDQRQLKEFYLYALGIMMHNMPTAENLQEICVEIGKNLYGHNNLGLALVYLHLASSKQKDWSHHIYHSYDILSESNRGVSADESYNLAPIFKAKPQQFANILADAITLAMLTYLDFYPFICGYDLDQELTAEQKAELAKKLEAEFSKKAIESIQAILGKFPQFERACSSTVWFKLATACSEAGDKRVALDFLKHTAIDSNAIKRLYCELFEKVHGEHPALVKPEPIVLTETFSIWGKQGAKYDKDQAKLKIEIEGKVPDSFHTSSTLFSDYKSAAIKYVEKGGQVVKLTFRDSNVERGQQLVARLRELNSQPSQQDIGASSQEPDSAQAATAPNLS